MDDIQVWCGAFAHHLTTLTENRSDWQQMIRRAWDTNGRWAQGPQEEEDFDIDK